MNRYLLAPILSAGLLTISCGSPTGVEPPARAGCGPRSVAAEDDVREATIRCLMGNKCEALEPSDHTGLLFCIGLHADANSTCDVWPCDPTPEFMKRFALEADTIAPVSACSVQTSRAVSRATGARAVVMTTGDVCWVGPNTVEIEATAYARLGSDMTFSLTLEREVKGWRVSKCKVTGVS